MVEPKASLAIDEVAQRLGQAGMTWAVFAGAAASVYGATRPLTDVDILVPAGEGERLATLFPEAQVGRETDGCVEWLKLAGFDLLAGLAWEDADAAYALDLDAPMAARLRQHQIVGVTVPVIPPEDNVLLKAIWGRGPEQGKHDWEDVQAMMTHLPSFDWTYLRWRAEVCGLSQRLEPLLERLEALRRPATATYVRQKLGGGDMRSIGRVEEVVSDVLNNPSLFGLVFEGMLADDSRIRMRCADAVEKITAKRPGFLPPVQAKLVWQVALSEQQEVRWHVAQMLPRLELSQEERQAAVETLLGYLDDKSRIVKTFSMQALADLAEEETSLRPRVIALLEDLTRSGSPAMKSRGRKLLKKLGFHPKSKSRQ